MFVPYGEVEALNQDKNDVLNRLQLDREQPLTVMLKDEEKCIRCGLCAIRCPTGAITMEQILVREQRVQKQ